MKKYNDWSLEELWDQEKMNFSVHILAMYSFLRSKKIDLEEFTNYVAAVVLPGWEMEAQTIDDFMNAVLVNVRANGGIVRKTTRGDQISEAVVSQLLEKEILRTLAFKHADSDQLWNKFVPIARSLHMRFTWKRLGNGDIQFSVSDRD
jgi:hypothetical protein